MRKILFWLFISLSVTMFAFASSVKFQVNMKVQSQLKTFDPQKDSVFLRGDFYTGVGNWWETNAMKLGDVDGDSIFVGTFDVGTVPKRLVKYKFVMRGITAAGDRWEVDMGSYKDRTDTVPSSPWTLPVVWFNNDSTSVYFDNVVTFKVNMNYQMKSGQFTKGADSVVVRGDFNGWGGKTHVLADADGDSVYTGAFNITSAKKIIYKFVKIRAAGEGWESSPDRVADNLTGPITTLPIVWFNNIDPAHGQVTFKVNLRVQTLLKKFDPAKDSVFLRGNFYTGAGNWWETNSMKLSDANNDTIYEGTFDVGSVPKRLGQFKFILRGVTVAGDRWEIDKADGVNKDRTDTVPTTPWALPVVWFDGDSTSVYFDNVVTFKVNMMYQMIAGQFTKGTDSVVVRGDFNGWGGKTHLLTDADGDSVYTGAFNIPSTKKLIYKFVKIRAGGEGWESSSDRIADNLTGPITTLPIVWFNNYNPAHGLVTFKVNLRVQTKLKKFDPAKDSVFLRGNFYAGPGNWWETNSMKLADADGDTIYTGTFDVGAVPKRLGQFKFIMRGASAAGDRWEIDKADGVNKDRTDTVPTTPWTLPVVWFNGDSTSVYFDNNITFRVNMKYQMKKGQFTKGADSVVVRGDFNGWGGKTHLLADADGDSIFSGVFNVASQKTIIFKFVKIRASGEGWESSPDRVIDSLTGPTTMLPLFNFNNDSILTSVDLKGSVVLDYELNQNYPNPFNPTTTIKYAIPSDNFVSLKLFNILGQEVANLVQEQQDAGRYEVKIDGSKLTSGIYLYRVEAGTFVSVKKMMLIK